MKKRLKAVLIIATALFGFTVSSCNSGTAGSGNDQSTTTGGQNTTTGESGTMGQQSWTKESVKNHVKSWKDTPKEAATAMVDKYGVPDEVTNYRLVWHNKGDFAMTMVTNEEIDHNFPMPHKDCLLQSVNYEVPVEKFTDIAKYDGSVVTERTKGTMAARCDKEAANYLALNLANDVAQGKRSVEDARSFYAKTIVSLMKGEKSDYTQKLMFQTKKNAGDSDQPNIDKKVLDELMGKK
ncbi:MAG: hypothetical protein H0V01_06405 [Bacteroidetes bacterium]|nr:hypothetical protein [Bacteroidota bacterium]HET6245181.1 hypothetical protein [Bacteroidia bacterium]